MGSCCQAKQGVRAFLFLTEGFRLAWFWGILEKLILDKLRSEVVLDVAGPAKKGYKKWPERHEIKKWESDHQSYVILLGRDAIHALLHLLWEIAEHEVIEVVSQNKHCAKRHQTICKNAEQKSANFEEHYY